MKTGVCLRVLWALLYLIAVNPGYADDEEEHEHDHDHEHAAEVVAYRLLEWKEMPFTDSDRAGQHLQAVQDLRCEARLETVDGTSTVSYRCEDWEPITLASHELAEQWEAWLDASGFDTSHGHINPELLEGPEIVEFRLTEWETAHTGDDDMEELIERLSSIGCEIEETEDGDHIDVNYRSPLWNGIHLPDHETAEEWMTWLEEHGFEAQHEHAEEHEHDHE